MTKLELRKKYKALRQQLTPQTVDTLSLDLANMLLQLDLWSYSFYHIFLPIVEHQEVNTTYILNILAGKDKNIVIPRSDFKTGNMSHVLLTDSTTIKKNKYNIPEPIDGIEIPCQHIEVVFVPLLAFNKIGHRVGYGKGFYDAFLAKCKPNTIKIGLSFFDAEPTITDTYHNDIALNYCVTPKRIYKF